MSAHTAFEDDEDLLFQKGINQIEAICERCGTPLLLIRDKDDEEYYFITEKPVQNK